MRNAHIYSGFRRRGENISEDLSSCVLFIIQIWADLNLKTKYKTTNLLTKHIFFSLQKSSLFPLRGKVSELSKRMRVLCWSIYIKTLCPEPLMCTEYVCTFKHMVSLIKTWFLRKMFDLFL